MVERALVVAVRVGAPSHQRPRAATVDQANIRLRGESFRALYRERFPYAIIDGR